MNEELVVIADQNAAVNTFSPLVHTARQGSEVGNGRSSGVTVGIKPGPATRLKS